MFVTHLPSKPLRLWPGVVLVILQCVLTFAVPVVAPEFTQYGQFGALACGAAIALWWLVFSRAPWPERLGAIALMIVVLFATSLFIDEPIVFLPFAIPALSPAFVAWAVASRYLLDAPLRWAYTVTTFLLAVTVCSVLCIYPWGLRSGSEILPPAFSGDGKEVFFIVRSTGGFFICTTPYSFSVVPDFNAGAREVRTFLWRDRVSIRRLQLDSGRIEVVRSWPGPLDRRWTISRLSAPFGTLEGGFNSRSSHWSGRPGYVLKIDVPGWAHYTREGFWDRRSGGITESGQWDESGSSDYVTHDEELSRFRDSKVVLSPPYPQGRSQASRCAIALYDGRTQTARLLFQARGCDTRQAVADALEAGREATAKLGDTKETPEVAAIRERLTQQMRAGGLDEYEARWTVKQKMYDLGYYGRPEGWVAEILSPKEIASLRLAQRTEFGVAPYLTVSDAELSSFPDVEEAIRNPAKRVDSLGHYYQAPGDRECAFCAGLRAIWLQKEGFIENSVRVYRIRLLTALAPGAPDATPSPGPYAESRPGSPRSAGDLEKAERAALQKIASISDDGFRQVLRSIVDAADTHFVSVRGALVRQGAGGQIWRANPQIPGARDCYVQKDNMPCGEISCEISAYFCYDALPGLNYLAAKAALKAYADKIQRVTGLPPQPLTLGRESEEDGAIFVYPTPAGTGDALGTSIELHLQPLGESRRNRLEIIFHGPRYRSTLFEEQRRTQ